MNQPSIHLNLSINRRNQRRLHNLIDQLFNDYSKLLAVRLDFYLQKDYDEINTYDYMNDAFRQLRNNLRFNSLFDYYITYAAKLEYGTDRLWHYHVVFFFDGQKVRSDYLLAKAIGEYWVKIINRGVGAFHSANLNKSKYQTVAIGLIDHREQQKIANLKVVVDYLVKDGNEYLSDRRDRGGRSYRSYRQGVYKTKEKILGRPRNVLYS